MPLQARQKSFIALLALLLLTVAAFLPGLGGRFLFDDYPNIVSNPKTHMEVLDTASLRNALGAFEPGTIGRPLATLSFAIDHYFGGTDPRGYKISSLLVHVVNALLVFLLASRLLALAWPGRASHWAALGIAAAWAVHPMQVSSVLYIVQRMETLSLTFVLMGLLAYLRGRVAQIEGRAGARWLLGSALLAAMGLLSKETAALFPLYALALELTVLRFAAADPVTAKRWRQAYAIAAVAAVAVFVLVVVPHFADPARYLSRDFSLGERLLTQLRVLPMYLGAILLPVPDSLLFYYDHIQPSRGLFTPWTTAAGGLLLAALLAAAWWLRGRAPLASLGLLWFFAAHAITSNVIPLELAFEHRNYFAILGVVLVLAELLHRIPARDGPAVVRIGGGALVLGLFALCLIRSATWGNPMLLASDMASRNPMSARAANDSGEQWMILAADDASSPYYHFARSEFARGAALPRASILPEQALILMAAHAGQDADPAWWDGLQHKLETRAISPQDRAGVTGLVRSRNQGLALDDAALSRAYETLASRVPMPPSLLATFADHALNQASRPDLAEQLFVAAVERSDPEYMLQLVEVLTAEGHTRHADAVVRAAAERGVIIR